MHATKRQSAHWLTAITITGFVGLMGALATVAPTQAAATAASPKPQLSITVSDGHTSVVAGNLLHYTVTVKNLGTAKVSNLVISQTEPTGMTLSPTTSAGTTNHAGVRWHLSLKPSTSAEVHSVMRVTTTPSAELQLATVACARTSVTASPIVCASHLDQLPAGRAAAAGSARMSSWWYVGGGSVVLIVLAGLVTFRRRRSPDRGAVTRRVQSTQPERS